MNDERVVSGCTLAFGLVILASSVLSIQQGGIDLGAVLGSIGGAMLVLVVLDTLRRPNRSIDGGSSVYLAGIVAGVLLYASGFVLGLL